MKKERLIPVKPIRKKLVSEEIIHQLKSLIDKGYILPGSKLPGERELAQRMNVSRLSLREALRALNLLGIIENQPGKGTYLSSSSDGWPVEPFSILFLINKNTLFEIFEARKILEGAVVALAADCRSDESLRAMEKALNNMKLHLGNYEKYEEYELEFHWAIIEAAGNSVIADLMEKLYRLLRETRRRLYHQYISRVGSYQDQDYQNHRVIFDSIRSRNPQRAAKAMTEHLLEFERILKDEQNRIIEPSGRKEDRPIHRTRGERRLAERR